MGCTDRETAFSRLTDYDHPFSLSASAKIKETKQRLSLACQQSPMSQRMTDPQEAEAAQQLQTSMKAGPVSSPAAYLQEEFWH